jgi:subfamily B ATP-binding cassette protein MsbA
LADGAVIERGRHHELLAQQGAYARMWTLQQSRTDDTPPTFAPSPA